MHAQDVTDVLALRDIIAGANNTATLIASLIDWRDGSLAVVETAVAQAEPEPAPAPTKAAPAKATKGRAKPPPPPADDDGPSPDPSDDADF
jgi:hypothetical protein